MSDYIITFTRSARKELEKLDSSVVNKIFPKVETLGKEPRPKYCRKWFEIQNFRI